MVMAVVFGYYMYQIIKDIKARANKGKLILTFKKEINGYLILGEICTPFILFIGEQIWERKNTTIFTISIGILIALLMIYCFYRGFRESELCENAIISPQGIYDLNRIRSYKYSHPVEVEEIVILRINIEDKLLFGKSKIKEIQFRFEKDKIDMVENIIMHLCKEECC
jgi:hypothetical protein